MRLVLLRRWRGTPDGGDGRRHLRGDGGVLPRRRLRRTLHVLQLLQLELLLQLLLQLLLADLLLQLLLLLLQVLLHVVLKMLLLQLLLHLLLLHLVLHLLLLHLLHLLLLHLLLLALHGRAHLGGRCCAHQGRAHGADKGSPNVRWHVGCDGDRCDNLVHGQSHG